MPTLKELRQYRFMSQVDLAKKAGVDSITISRLERGIQKPSLQTMRKLADALEVELVDIEFQQRPKEDYWKDLQLLPKLKEVTEAEAEAKRQSPTDEYEAEGQRLEAEVEVITIEGELADRLRSNKPSPTKEEAEEPEPNPEVDMGQATPAWIGEIDTQAEAEGLVRAAEGSVSHEGDAEGNLGDRIRGEATPEHTVFLSRKVADEPEPKRATMATASVLPLGLLGTKKAWLFILALVCVAIAGYFLWRSHLRKGEVASPPKEPVKNSGGDPVRDFLDNY